MSECKLPISFSLYILLTYYSFATICAFILDIRVLRKKDTRGSYGRTLGDQASKEPLRHKGLPKGFTSEETQYLRPESTEQLYDPGASSPSAPLRSLSPVPANERTHELETYSHARRARSVSPGVSRWKEGALD